MLTPDTRRRLGCALAGARSPAVIRFLLTDYCDTARRMAHAQGLPAGLFILPLRRPEDLSARHGVAATLHLHDTPGDARAIGLAAELAGLLRIALRRLHDLEQHQSGIERATGECAA